LGVSPRGTYACPLTYRSDPVTDNAGPSSYTSWLVVEFRVEQYTGKAEQMVYVLWIIEYIRELQRVKGGDYSNRQGEERRGES
jgi:hypothetical protein